MLSIAGSGRLVNSRYTENASSGLDVQLSRYKVELADWINCPACKTPAGKAKIQELSDKIAAIELKIKAPPAQNPVSPETRSEALGVGSLGSRLNTYA